MPQRVAGEPLSHFVGRFVSNKKDKKRWPDIKQRLAIAYSESRKRKHAHAK